MNTLFVHTMYCMCVSMMCVLIYKNIHNIYCISMSEINSFFFFACMPVCIDACVYAIVCLCDMRAIKSDTIFLFTVHIQLYVHKCIYYMN